MTKPRSTWRPQLDIFRTSDKLVCLMLPDGSMDMFGAGKTVADVMNDYPGFYVGSLTTSRPRLAPEKALHPGSSYYLTPVRGSVPEGVQCQVSASPGPLTRPQRRPGQSRPSRRVSLDPGALGRRGEAPLQSRVHARDPFADYGMNDVDPQWSLRPELVHERTCVEQSTAASGVVPVSVSGASGSAFSDFEDVLTYLQKQTGADLGHSSALSTSRRASMGQPRSTERHGRLPFPPSSNAQDPSVRFHLYADEESAHGVKMNKQHQQQHRSNPHKYSGHVDPPHMNPIDPHKDVYLETNHIYYSQPHPRHRLPSSPSLAPSTNHDQIFSCDLKRSREGTCDHFQLHSPAASFAASFGNELASPTPSSAGMHCRTSSGASAPSSGTWSVASFSTSSSTAGSSSSTAGSSSISATCLSPSAFNIPPAAKAPVTSTPPLGSPFLPLASLFEGSELSGSPRGEPLVPMSLPLALGKPEDINLAP